MEIMALRKKRRVAPEPNSAFVGLREVQCTQMEAGAIEGIREESPDSGDFEDIIECIVVG